MNESLSATVTINGSVEAIFAVIADPATHPAIDGTGWVRGPVEGHHLTASGQIFRMAMYHPEHPNKSYEMANQIEVFDPPYAISWKPGYDPGNGELQFGGWIWRYDLRPIEPSVTEVRLSYDWSAVAEEVRRAGPVFPPFPADHLLNSLHHLTDLISPSAD